MQYIIPIIQTSTPNDLDTQTVLILFVEIVIVIIYLISLFLVIIRRAKKLLELNNRKYYILIIIYIVTKSVLCGILMVEIVVGMAKDWSNIDPVEVQLLIKTGIILADFCMIELFLVALQTYLTHCFSAMSDVFTNSRSKILSHALNIMQLLVGLVLLIPLLIFDIDRVAYDVINGVSIGLNLIVIIAFLATFFYMNFKMTGVMMENKLNEVIKRIYKVQLIILISRAISLVFQIMIAMYVLPKSFREEIEILILDVKYQVILGSLFVGSVLFMLITEGLPIMYSLRSAVVTALNHKSELVADKQSIFTDHSLALEQSLVENQQEDYRKDIVINKELKLKNFTKVLDIKTQKEQSIWVLKKGQYDGKDYMIRISKHQISSYILEDIENQLGHLIQCNIKSLSKMNYFCEGQIIHLVEKYYHVPLQKKLMDATSETQIIRLSLQIAEGIKQLHLQEISHGCLSPQHIYFDESQVIFNGFGLHSFKKYLSLITGYNNKSIYTAIQHLKDKNNVILKPKKSSDIYSFGIILYQLVTKNVQYRQLTLNDIQTKFAEQNFRPKLPEHIKFQVKNLIRKCWNEISEKRPTIDEVIETLRKLT